MMRRNLIALFACLPAIAFSLGAQPTLSSVEFKPSSIQGGRTTAAVVTLSDVAPGNGVQVLLSLSANSAQLAASSITIAGGQRSATVQVTTRTTAATEVATLKASAGGVLKTASLTITPPLSIRIDFPSSAKTGETVVLTVQSNIPAPKGGFIVQLTSTGFRLFEGSVETATDTIQEGQTSASRKITIPRALRDYSFTIAAATHGATASRSATIVGPHLLGLSVSPFEVRIGGEFILSASLVEPAPEGGVTLELSATGLPEGMTIPTSMTVPAGTKTGHRRIVMNGVRPAARSGSIFKVRLNGEETTAQLAVIP